MIRAHQPGSEPIDIPETIPNPVVVPKPTHPLRQNPLPRSQFGSGEGSLARRPFRQVSPALHSDMNSRRFII